MSTEKKETAKTVAMPKTAEPKKILSIEEQLNKQLSEINRKKELADRRNIFLLKCGEVSECLTDLTDEQAAGQFSTDNFSLIFARKNGYSDKEAFRISNPGMMIKFLSMLQSEMLEAVKVIESELLKDI